MKKINIVKNNIDFNRIIKDNKPFKCGPYYLYVEKGNYDIYRFGISVGKKIGGAVIRNKYKRRIRNIIDKKVYKNGFNCIIIVNRRVLDLSFDQMKDYLFKAFDELKLVKEECE